MVDIWSTNEGDARRGDPHRHIILYPAREEMLRAEPRAELLEDTIWLASTRWVRQPCYQLSSLIATPRPESPRLIH